MKDFNNSEILIYQSENGVTKIDVTFMDETVWLSKAQMAELFQRDRSVISKHIKKVFEEGELPRESNVQILHIANSDKPVEFYNLDVIISVGYRVKSQRGVQFRIWATNVLKVLKDIMCKVQVQLLNEKTVETCVLLSNERN